MSLFPKTCPHCDAGPGPYVNSYLCGTYLRAGVDARKHQTKRCVTGQMFAWVERAHKAEARCKRMEEAGDAMADWNMNERNLGCDPELAHKWHQAKEAKPCPYCLRVECECSDFDVAPDMGDK